MGNHALLLGMSLHPHSKNTLRRYFLYHSGGEGGGGWWQGQQFWQGQGGVEVGWDSGLIL